MYDKHYNKNDQNFKGISNFRDKRNRGDKINLKIETGHMTEGEVGIETTEEDSVGIEDTVDLGVEVDSCLGITVKKDVTCRNGIKLDRGNEMCKSNK